MRRSFGAWAARFYAWLLANMVPTGKSTRIAAKRLQAMGFSLAIYPTAGTTAACAALKAAYEHIRAHGTTQGAPISSISMSELHDLVGFPEIWDFERRFVEQDFARMALPSNKDPNRDC